MTFANVGGADRAIRLVAGLAALVVGMGLLGASRGEFAGIVVAGLGGLMLLTSAIRFCPAYLPIGFSTCKPRSD